MDGGRDLQGRNGGDFAQVLALLVAEVKVFAIGDFAHFGCAASGDLQRWGTGPMLGNEPADDLFGIDI
jgi:hypothetical protein